MSQTMTPGLRCVKAFEDRDYAVRKAEAGFCDEPGSYERVEDREVAGIIEQYSGIVELIKAVEKLLAVCKHDDVLPHVQGHVELVERTIRKVSWADEL